MTLKEISKSLKGKVSKEERFFRCLITHLIQTEGIQSLYNMKKFCNYLISIGEQDGSEMFIFIKQRREEYLKSTEDIILKHLMVVK
tara:strand:- start:439 stop:696 length:258 start_codon:yes stop_codon:yes gene_type:complete